MKSFEFTREPEQESLEELYSKPVRAGRRTYYFDVKATRNDDYYVTITESRKKVGPDGGFSFDKSKLHLYKEDFVKFAEGLQDVLMYIKQHKPELLDENGEFFNPVRSETADA